MPGIRVGLQLLGGGEVTLELVVAAETLGERLQAGIFHRQFAELL